jgi:hypothetical protein
MNDGSKSSGLAATLTIKGTEGAWKLFRAKPMTAAEKMQAKTLAPPPRTDAQNADDRLKNEGTIEHSGTTPQPPPGQSQKATK